MTDRQLAARRPPPRDDLDWGQVLDELLALAGGAGFFFIAFMAAIPGLVPAVILVVVPLVLLTVAVLVVGLVLGLVAGVAWLAVRTARLLRS